MIRFTTHDASGRLDQAFEVFSAEEVLENVPDGMFAVSGWGDCRTQYAKAGELRDYPPSPGAWAVWDIDSETWTDPRSEADLAAALALARTEGIARINAAAGTIRRQFVTDLPGQEMLYLRKEAEGAAWLAATDPDLAGFPLMAAEIGITAPDADQLAQVWLNMSALWVDVASQLEHARLGAILGIEQAETPAIIDAIVTSFLTPGVPA